MKRILQYPAILIMVFGCTLSALGQQNFQLSQYMNGSLMINPAMSGIEDQMEINLGFRKQWTNWSGLGASPTTTYFSANTRLPFNSPAGSVSMPLHTSNDGEADVINKEGKQRTHIHGVGIYAYSDQYVYFKRFTGGLTYASHFEITDDINLSAGGSLGITNNALDGNQLTIYDNQSDASYTSLLANNNSRVSADLNLGLVLYAQNFFVGYSANQLTRGKQFSSSTGLNGTFAVHHYIIAGYNLKINDDLNFTPSIIVQTLSKTPVTMDVTAKFLYQKKYWGGLSYRNEDAIVLFAGTKLGNNIGFSYSFDVNISEMKNYSSGGHEISLGIVLAKKGNPVLNDFIWQ